jgi:hypothetical protein
MKKLIYCFLLCVSCEKTIEIEEMAFEPQLVVNALFDQGRDNYLYLLSNYPATGIDSLRYVSGAVISLSGGGSPILLLTEEEGGHYVFPQNELETGIEYELSVNKKGYPVASSFFRIPRQPVMRIIDTANKEQLNEFSNPTFEITIEYDDPAGEENFYMIELLRHYSVGEEIAVKEWPLTINSDDLSIDFFSNGGLEYGFYHDNLGIEGSSEYPKALFFCDKLNDGNKNSITIKTDESFYFNDSYLYVNFWNISPEYYQFVKSVASFRKNSMSMFAEPLQMYSNIRNGLGYLIVSNVITDSIRIN